MSAHFSNSSNLKKVSIRSLQKFKQQSLKFTMVTCYDATFARLLDETEIDMVLVGDSLGNVMLGLDNTTSVTMDHMLLFTSAVSRVMKRPLLCADLPFLSYFDVSKALESAGRLVSEAGAQCVKLEGGLNVVPQVKALSSNGIPVIGHLGLTPQHLHSLGGHRVQARDMQSQERLLSDALALEKAGASAIVLELVPHSVAEVVTKNLNIPTIGIGAGSSCDGQVLVLQDLLGFDDNFKPKFLKQYLNIGKLVKEAVNQYDQEVKTGLYPDLKHSFE